MLLTRRNFSLFVVVGLGCALAVSARADIVLYDDESDWVANAGSPTGADFDAFTGLVNTQYPLVAFNPFNSGTPTSFNMDVTAWDPVSSPNAMRTRGWARGGGGWALDFYVPVTAVGFSIWGLQFPGTSVEVLNQNNDSLSVFDAAEVAIGEGPVNWAFVGLVSSDADIARIEVAVNPADFVVFDDVQFGTLVGIPEPAALTLMALGGGALLFRRRLR